MSTLALVWDRLAVQLERQQQLNVKTEAEVNVYRRFLLSDDPMASPESDLEQAIRQVGDMRI